MAMLFQQKAVGALVMFISQGFIEKNTIRKLCMMMEL